MSQHQDYANGTVIEITMGSAEFTPILQSASTNNQLTLLDFSAQWCGPCKMLKPVLDQLAVEYRGRLVVVKMDCEATDANRSLAAANTISAYPTLKLYIQERPIETIRGANPAMLRQYISRYLDQLGPPRNSSPQNLALELAKALAVVKNSCSFPDFIVAAKTLTTYVGNIVQNPNDPKYRKIKLSNAAFSSRLGSRPGGKECLKVLGFQERMEAMETVMVLDTVPLQLKSVLELLQQAIADAERATPISTTTVTDRSGEDNTGQTIGNNTAVVDTMGASSSSRNEERRSDEGQRRRITPAKLAKVLEKIMIDEGFGRKT